MTPQTLIIDRSFRGVGRVKRATGTTIPKVRDAISRMLTSLHQAGRLDVLRAIRDGKLEMLQVYDAFRRNAVDTLPMANTLEPLGPAWAKWSESGDGSDKAKESHGTSLTYLLGAKADAQVSDIPAILEMLRDTLGKRHPRSFNMARSNAMSFVRSTLKRNHPLWAAIGAVEPRKISKKKKRKGVHLTPTQMRNWFPNPDTDPLDGLAWSMATTGMHRKEYWFDGWEVLEDRIHVLGDKRDPRDRYVPLVRVPVPASMHPRTFENKLRERTNSAIQPYDLRRTYAHWMELASIPRARRKTYMGHSSGDVTDLYEMHEVDTFLVDDAERLRKYLDLPPTKAHTMTLLTSKGA